MKRLPCVSLTACAATLLLFASPPASAGDGGADDFVTCSVRIDLAGAHHEAPSSAPTVEEAADLAFESACALACVAATDDTDDDEDAGPEDAPIAVTGDTEAVEDPDGVEACIEVCVEDAELLGTHCTDAAARTVYADGSFDESDSPDDDADADAPGEEDDSNDDDDDDAP